jgi:hypothetical protein
MVSALVTTGAVTAPGVAAAEPAGSPTVNWQPCPDADGVDCATIEVPLDWSKPRGEKIHIGLARRAATDPSRRIGSILVDPGGPGGSGVDMVKAFEPFTDEVNARFDRVGFDPRGINTSSQLLCDVDLSELPRRHVVQATPRDHERLADDLLRARPVQVTERVGQQAEVALVVHPPNPFLGIDGDHPFPCPVCSPGSGHQGDVLTPAGPHFG